MKIRLHGTEDEVRETVAVEIARRLEKRSRRAARRGFCLDRRRRRPGTEQRGNDRAPDRPSRGEMVGACSVEVELRNDSQRPLNVNEAFDRFEVFLENGSTVSLFYSAKAPLEIQPGKTRALTLRQACYGDDCPAWRSAPALARVGTPFGWKLLSVSE